MYTILQTTEQILITIWNKIQNVIYAKYHEQPDILSSPLSEFVKNGDNSISSQKP